MYDDDDKYQISGFYAFYSLLLSAASLELSPGDTVSVCFMDPGLWTGNIQVLAVCIILCRCKPFHAFYNINLDVTHE